MATFNMCYITGKLARTVLWILMFILLLKRVFSLVISNSFRLSDLIYERKFMYIVLNSIIISIFISSSSFIPYITNIFLKVHQKSKVRFNSQKVMPSSPDDDDTWWFFTYMDHEQPMECTRTSTIVEEDETVSLFRVHEQEKTIMESTTTSSTDDEENIKSSFRVLDQEKEERIGEVKNTKEEEEEEEEGDDLDATWKAIMESKGKGNRPQLRKSDTWSCDDGGGEEREKEKGKMGKLSKYRIRGKLKKWQSFREMVERRAYVGGDISGGDGGEKSGWRSMEVALTFHDEFKKRADAFIARFTHDIRLQRLESDQRFLEMINRGL